MPDYVNYNGKGIGEYVETEPWENYVERLTCHFNGANVKNEGQRRDIFLANIGAKYYELLKNLLGLAKPSDKSFTDLCKVIKEHKTPTPPWQSERLKFLSRNRVVHPENEKETVMEYLAVLKNLMKTCQYSGTEYNHQLRDRLLHGCNDAEMQAKMI